MREARGVPSGRGVSGKAAEKRPVPRGSNAEPAKVSGREEPAKPFY